MNIRMKHPGIKKKIVIRARHGGKQLRCISHLNYIILFRISKKIINTTAYTLYNFFYKYRWLLMLVRVMFTIHTLYKMFLNLAKRIVLHTLQLQLILIRLAMLLQHRTGEFKLTVIIILYCMHYIE